MAFKGADDSGFSYAVQSAARPAAPSRRRPTRRLAAPDQGLVFGANGPRAMPCAPLTPAPTPRSNEAYDALTAHLDREGLIVDDVYLEELVALGETADDPATRVGILVFPN